jgi:hypothetical protein
MATRQSTYNPNRSNGTPDYDAGEGGGTCSVPDNALLHQVSVWAVGVDGTFTIDGEDPIMIRADVGRGFDFIGKWVGPFDIVFDASLDWFVEWSL